ncbi:hypothetical protein TNCT_25311 [Trichonephila clavata]|uniref:Uncharacterized protein n=2 Tax=Trichonephila clavata TaxID=2740835 RepID=A0A8X6FIG2_TRICU|nr:hypothetical protein TNCT_25311 [Trichonephila clavata]
MHRISSRYHVPKGRPSKRKMQALLKAKKRWASGEIELEHQSLHENDPDASGNVSSNYENNEVNTYPLNSSELNAATERKLSLLSSHTSAEHVISEQNDPTYVLVDTNVWKNLLSTVKCPECDMNNLNIIKTTQLGMASKLELFYVWSMGGGIDQAEFDYRFSEESLMFTALGLGVGKLEKKLSVFARETTLKLWIRIRKGD